MNDDWPLFEPPSQDQLARHADDLMHRANLVRRYGWGRLPASLVTRRGDRHRSGPGRRCRAPAMR